MASPLPEVDHVRFPPGLARLALGEERPAPPEEPVQAPCQPDLEALHAAGERLHPRCLHQEMQVISDHDEVDDAKIRPMAAGLDGALHDAKRTAAPERGDVGQHAQGDVEREPCGEAVALAVRHSRSAARSPGARTPPAEPGRTPRIVQRELARSI